MRACGWSAVCRSAVCMVSRAGGQRIRSLDQE